jgi:hypothetical protein
VLNPAAQCEIGTVTIPAEPDSCDPRPQVVLEAADPGGEVARGGNLNLRSEVGIFRVDADVRVKVDQPREERAPGQGQNEIRRMGLRRGHPFSRGSTGTASVHDDTLARDRNHPGSTREVVDSVDQPVRLEPEHARRRVLRRRAI